LFDLFEPAQWYLIKSNNKYIPTSQHTKKINLATSSHALYIGEEISPHIQATTSHKPTATRHKQNIKGRRSLRYKDRV